MLSEQQVQAILGGAGTLGREVDNPADFDDLLRDGLPWAAASHAKQVLRMSDEVFAALLETSPRTLSRWKKARKRLDLVASDRLYRLALIVAMAEEVFEDHERALHWLNRPQVGLGGRVPLDMIRTEAGSREVENLLGRLEYGVLS